MESEWITARETARRLEVHWTNVAKVIEAGEIRVRQLPGMLPRYNAADVARVAAESIIDPSKQADSRAVPA